MKIQKYNTQTLQLFTEIIKIESIYKHYKKAKLEGLGAGPSGLIKSGGKHKGC